MNKQPIVANTLQAAKQAKQPTSTLPPPQASLLAWQGLLPIRCRESLLARTGQSPRALDIL